MSDTLYAWGTPNGLKPILLFEELGIPYTLERVDLGKSEQLTPAYLSRNPNGKIPLLHTQIDGESVFLAESGAILVHVADREGRFLAAGGAERARTLQWVMFQLASIGPNFGQRYHFTTSAPEKLAYPIERFTKECKRLLALVDAHLAQNRYFAGSNYSIADMMSFFWLMDTAHLGADIADYPNLARWIALVGERPAVKRTLALKFGGS